MSNKSNTITLNQAIELKQNIQELLINKRNVFKNENCFPTNSERNYDLKKIVSEKEDLSEKFVLLKLEIQKANLTIPEGEKECISTLVYKLSEIKNDIINFEDSLKPASYIDGTRVIDGQEVVFKPKYNSITINDWLSVLRKEHYYITNKLTKLNNLITINLPFDPKDLL